jgi:hypothetical protein
VHACAVLGVGGISEVGLLIREGRVPSRAKRRGLSPEISSKPIAPLDIRATQMRNGEWAIVSSNKRKPLSEAEANCIVAAYMAVTDLLKSTV